MPIELNNTVEFFRAGCSFSDIEAENVGLPDECLGQMFSSFVNGMGLGKESPIIMTAGEGDTQQIRGEYTRHRVNRTEGSKETRFVVGVRAGSGYNVLSWLRNQLDTPKADLCEC